MSAFLDLLNTYAIWIYLIGVSGILFAIKMLVDSRRQARTTLFTLEQEQASDQAFRAVLLMVVFTLLIAGVTVINAVIGTTRPVPTPEAAKQTVVSFTPPIILPTATTIPTFTPESPTPALSPTVPPTRGIQPTPIVQPTTPVPETPTPAPQNTPTPTTAAQYPVAKLSAPRNGEPISNSRIQFIWGQNELPAQLPPDQFYRATIQYTDRDTKSPRTLTKCTYSNSVDTKEWGAELTEAQGKAVGNLFSWSVVAVQVPSRNPSDCDAGQGILLSPPSETWTFTWP